MVTKVNQIQWPIHFAPGVQIYPFANIRTKSPKHCVEERGVAKEQASVQHHRTLFRHNTPVQEMGVAALSETYWVDRAQKDVLFDAISQYVEGQDQHRERESERNRHTCSHEGAELVPHRCRQRPKVVRREVQDYASNVKVPQHEGGLRKHEEPSALVRKLDLGILFMEQSNRLFEVFLIRPVAWD
jgi:hypothetical protein